MEPITVMSVAYQIDGQPYEGRLAFDPSREDPLPGLLMAPNWMGISAEGRHIVKVVAGIVTHRKPLERAGSG